MAQDRHRPQAPIKSTHAQAAKTTTCKDYQLEILEDFNINVYCNSVCVNYNLVYRFRNAHCIKRLIVVRIVTLLISEVIIVKMHTLLYTIKVSMHACFVFDSLEFNPHMFDYLASSSVCSAFCLYLSAKFKQ